MALTIEEIRKVARERAKEVLERHKVPEVIDNQVVQTVVEMGLGNCQCSREARGFYYELATIQHGNLARGIPDEHKVAKAIDYFSSNVDERIYGAYLKPSGCEITLPWGASLSKLKKLYEEDWRKANNLLGEITSAIDAGAAHRGGGACEALEVLIEALAQSK